MRLISIDFVLNLVLGGMRWGVWDRMLLTANALGAETPLIQLGFHGGAHVSLKQSPSSIQGTAYTAVGL
jgi:hypothetical protein